MSRRQRIVASSPCWEALTIHDGPIEYGDLTLSGCFLLKEHPMPLMTTHVTPKQKIQYFTVETWFPLGGVVLKKLHPRRFIYRSPVQTKNHH